MQHFQAVYQLGLALQIGQGDELVSHVVPVECRALTNQNAIHIHPVLASSGKGFHYDQVLSRTGPKRDVWWVGKRRGTLDHGRFEGQSSQGHVKTDAARGSK